MAADEKRVGQGVAKTEGPVVGDTTTRARNRTVMMTSELTGQVRARLGGEFQRPTPERSGGFVQETKGADDGWLTPELDASSVTSTEFAPEGQSEEPHEESSAHEPAYEEQAQESDNHRKEDTEELPSDDDGASTAGAAGPSRRPIAPTPPVNYTPEEDDYVYLKEEPIESAQEAPRARGESPVRILRPKPLPRLSPQQSSEEQSQIAPQQARPTREFKPMSQEEYLETFVVPPEQTQADEVEMKDSITWTAESTLVGFLISYDNNPKGDYVELRTGRLMVTCEFESSGNCLVVAHPSVSPMHAIMRVGTGGTIQVLDQLSENGTKIRHAGTEEEEFLSGEKGTLSHGDVVLFGERSFYVCLIKPPTE